MNYAPPSGRPLGTNKYFQGAVLVVIPILRALTKRTWIGQENLPKSGPVIVVCNHISYADPLLFAHFLYSSGRAPRFLGKASVFTIPIIGKIIAGSGQIPVNRESDSAKDSLAIAKALLEVGHCFGVYPEGTLTRDENGWPMRAKTGIARLAIATQVPVIPCAQWGAQDLLAPYAKVPRIWRRTRITVKAGAPLNFAKWQGREDDPDALEEATRYVMSAITSLLEEIRGESAPLEIFDPRTSNLPRVGNYKKSKNNKD